METASSETSGSDNSESTSTSGTTTSDASSDEDGARAPFLEQRRAMEALRSSLGLVDCLIADALSAVERSAEMYPAAQDRTTQDSASDSSPPSDTLSDDNDHEGTPTPTIEPRAWHTASLGSHPPDSMTSVMGHVVADCAFQFASRRAIGTTTPDRSRKRRRTSVGEKGADQTGRMPVEEEASPSREHIALPDPNAFASLLRHYFVSPAEVADFSSSSEQSPPIDAVGGSTDVSEHDNAPPRTLPPNSYALRIQLQPLIPLVKEFATEISAGADELGRLSHAFPDASAWFFCVASDDRRIVPSSSEPLIYSQASETITRLVENEEDLQRLYWEATRQQQAAAACMAKCREHLRVYKRLIDAARPLERQVGKEAYFLRQMQRCQRTAAEEISSLVRILQEQDR